MRNYSDMGYVGKGSPNDFEVGGYTRCYESHKALPLVGGLVVYGGSCSTPIVKDADIYVGLDLSHRRSEKVFPWVEGESFLYYIQDMTAPKDPVSFIHMIDWLALQILSKKKVHIGCIGGHGRTGTVLAALVAVMTEEKDAIEYVRKHYCHKAVESSVQVDFLVKHFGVLKAQGAKEYAPYTPKGSPKIADPRSPTAAYLSAPRPPP